MRIEDWPAIVYPSILVVKQTVSLQSEIAPLPILAIFASFEEIPLF